MRVDIKAYHEREGVKHLALDAADVAAARSMAEAQGYRVIAARAAQWRQGAGMFAGRGFSASLFCQELLALLDAGMVLVESIAILSRKARHPETRRILAELNRQVGEGRAFSRALAGVPDAFPELLIATVRASENTGNLPEALRRYLDYHRQINRLRDKIVSASVYPVLLGVVGLLVVLFLLAYVVPRFAKVYEEVGESRLPVLSRWLMHWGQAVGDHTLVLSMGLVSLLAGVGYVLTRPEVRTALIQKLWQLPTVGEQLRVYQLGRFTRTVAMLLKGGIPLLRALDMTDALMRQPVLNNGLTQAKQAIREGRAVSEAFSAHGLATDVGTRLLVVGERSGELGAVMERIAIFYEEEVGRSVEWFSRLFEPLLMVVIGLLIGGIVILMYMPIFELASSIQ